MLIARGPHESKNPSLWNGLVGGIRAGGGYAFQPFVYPGSVKYIPLNNAEAAPTALSPGQEILGSAILIQSSSYFRRYPISITYPWSASIWFLQVQASTYGDIYALSDDAGNAFLILTIEPAGLGQRLDIRRLSGGFAATQSTGQVSLEVWHHFAMVVESTSALTCYMDGVPVISVSSTIPSDSVFTTVGVGRFNYSTNVSGSANDGSLLGECLEYNRALSVQEIQALASGRSPFEKKAWHRISKSFFSAKPWIYSRRTQTASVYTKAA